MSSKREQQEAAGRWLRQARERRGFATVGALARRLGVSESLVSRYETGLSAISDERAEQIADALGMNIVEVRRGLGLWVPPTPGAPPARKRREDMSLDELLDEAERLMAEVRRRRRAAREEVEESTTEPNGV